MMTPMVDRLPGLPPLPSLPDLSARSPLAPAEQVTKSFGDILQGYLTDLTTAQSHASALTNQFVAGGPIDISQVAIALEESSLSMQLLLEVRNKVMDAYETLLRMPV